MNHIKKISSRRVVLAVLASALAIFAALGVRADTVAWDKSWTSSHTMGSASVGIASDASGNTYIGMMGGINGGVVFKQSPNSSPTTPTFDVLTPFSDYAFTLIPTGSSYQLFGQGSSGSVGSIVDSSGNITSIPWYINGPASPGGLGGADRDSFGDVYIAGGDVFSNVWNVSKYAGGGGAGPLWSDTTHYDATQGEGALDVAVDKSTNSIY